MRREEGFYRMCIFKEKVQGRYFGLDTLNLGSTFQEKEEQKTSWKHCMQIQLFNLTIYKQQGKGGRGGERKYTFSRKSF